MSHSHRSSQFSQDFRKVEIFAYFMQKTVVWKFVTGVRISRGIMNFLSKYRKYLLLLILNLQSIIIDINIHHYILLLIGINIQSTIHGFTYVFRNETRNNTVNRLILEGIDICE